MKPRLIDFERNGSKTDSPVTGHRNEMAPSKFIKAMCVIVVLIMVSVSLAVLVQQTSMKQKDIASISAPKPPPTSKPDLYVSLMQIIDAYGNVATVNYGLTLGAGQDFKVDFRVTNGGTAAAKTFSVDLFIDQSDATTKNCGRLNCTVNLPVGGVYINNWTGVFTSISGPAVVRIVADSTNNNAESNENNNVKTLTETVANADRTVAIYMCADNNLEQFAIRDFINEMAAVGSSNRLSIVVMMDRSAGYETTYGDWTDARYFFVKLNSTCYDYDAVKTVGEVNMGDPATLHDFAAWTYDRYRASLFDLVLWDHGGVASGVCQDFNSGTDDLTMNELSDVLRDLTGSSHINKKLDVIGFDACFQGWIENVYSCGKYATAVAASVNPIYGGGWPYDDILNELRTNPSMNASALCRFIVDYCNYTWTHEFGHNYDGYCTMAAFNSAGIDTVAARISTLAGVLRSKLSDPILKSQISDARNETDVWSRYGPFEPNLGADPLNMSLQLQIYCTDSEIDNAAQNVINAMLDPGTVIDYGAGFNLDLIGLRCLGIIWPKQLIGDVSPQFGVYRKCQFSVDTSWDEFLVAFMDLQPPVASFTDTVNQLVVSVDASASSGTSGIITGYSWNWGDGSAAGSGITATHTYSTAGTKTITLTVTDNFGSSASTSRPITVVVPPFTDNFDDGTLSPWTATGSQVFVSNLVSHSAPYGLYVRYSVSENTGTQRATSPAITSIDFAGPYSVGLWYYRDFAGVSRTSPQMYVVEDGRISILDKANNFYAVTSSGNQLIAASQPFVWSKFQINVDPATSSYQVFINDVYVGTYAFLAQSASKQISVGSPVNPTGRIACWGYWDDIIVQSGYWLTDTDHDGISDHDEIVLGTDPYGIGKWALIMSGGNPPGFPVDTCFEWQVDQAILTLQQQGFTDASIRALSLTRSYSDPDGDSINDIDMTSSRANIQASMAWLASNADADDTVVICLVDHGEPNSTLGPLHGTLFIGAENLFDFELGTWADQVTCHLMTVIIDCCNAGLWEDDLAGPGRMVLMATSSSGTTLAPMNGFNGTPFTESLFDAIGQNMSVEAAFDYANNVVLLQVPPRINQYPCMNDFDPNAEIYILYNAVH